MTTSSSPSTVAATPSSHSASSPVAQSVYKGKITHRSWQHLPPEIIRLIGTHYLFDASSTNYMPLTWEPRECWLPRMVYTVLRDAMDLEKLMIICPSWSAALEHHLFWHQACAAIDPHDTLAHYAVVRPPPQTTNAAGSVMSGLPYRVSPYRHFRSITNCSCFVCRINAPYSSIGLTAGTRRPIQTLFLSTIYVCRDHRKHTFCGLCLREAPHLEMEPDFNAVCCMENEDEETWPGVEATCRSCRSEFLWRRVSSNSRDRDAVGGHKWNSADWETRQSVDAFIEMGEGTISDVVALAQEKHWLRMYTKLPDMLSQAVAASRYTTREEGLRGYDSGSEEEEEEEEDPELMSLTEDAGGVRELAIGDWARSRILDGYWCSPADQWYSYTVNDLPTAVKAEHPCPWNSDAIFSMDGEEDGEDAVHPRQSTISAEIPPTYQLCEQTYIAFQRQMRIILLPAMKNIVRKLVIECIADGEDPVRKVNKMNAEIVVKALRDEGVWYDGIDWLERRRNGRREREARERAAMKEEADDSSSSSKSDSSHTTSPVLSTSTLQTTPSPPPSYDKKDEDFLSPRSLPIPISPVLEPPVLLHPIPYIPVTVAQMPRYSMEAFTNVWREACAPLYHCGCSICQRAILKANGGHGPDNGKTAPTRNQVVSSPVEAATDIPYNPDDKLFEIQLEEASPEDVGEDEVGSGEEQEESSDESEMEEITGWHDQLGGQWIKRPRKRSSEELDEDAVGESVDEGEDACRGREKRARCHEERKIVLESPRLTKRRSEELDGEEVGGGKRMRIRGDVSSEEDASPPASITGTGESDSVPSVQDDDEDILRRNTNTYHSKRIVAADVVSDSDLDGLYTFGSQTPDTGGLSV